MCSILCTVSSSLPVQLLCTWLRFRVGISVISSWEARERSLQVRRDALCSVGVPNCSKVRAIEGDKCLNQEKSKQGAAAGNSLKIENWILSFLSCDSHCVTRCFKNVCIQEEWVPKNLDDTEYLTK